MGSEVWLLVVFRDLMRRDTAVLGYNSALNSEPDLYPRISELDDLIYAFVNLAIIVTEREVA
jgi:hypothetical protein